MNPYGQAERAAVEVVGGRYVDVTPWFCSATCTAVIGRYQVYFNKQHVMGPYAAFLGGVMAQALQLPTSGDAAWQITPKVLLPMNGAVLKGTVALSAGANIKGTPDHAVAQVLLTGGSYSNAVVANAYLFTVGWLARWNTATVPNGEYTITIHITTRNGGVGTSSPVQVQVRN
jgi:hypothetical protein